MAAEAWHRRHALQIAAALPESVEDALLVIAIVMEMVSPNFGFIATDQPDLERDRGNVVSLSSTNKGIIR